MVFFNQLLLSAIIKQYQNSIITDFKFSKSLILCGFREFCLLLPLDGCGRLGGDVVDDAVDVADLVDDARGRAVEDVVR